MSKSLVFIAVLAAAAFFAPGAFAQDIPSMPTRAQLHDRWQKTKKEAREWLPTRVEDARDKISRMKIVKRPETVLDSYSQSPELLEAINSFYDFIKGRELDVYEEQEGLPDFFPDRDAYYDFLDTVLPAMRDRKFERNRVLEYQVHAIEPVEGEPGIVDVTMSVTSDDVLPFKKLMVYHQRWEIGAMGWFPGKISADPATYWERIR